MTAPRKTPRRSAPPSPAATTQGGTPVRVGPCVDGPISVGGAVDRGSVLRPRGSAPAPNARGTGARSSWRVPPQGAVFSGSSRCTCVVTSREGRHRGVVDSSTEVLDSVGALDLLGPVADSRGVPCHRAPPVGALRRPASEQNDIVTPCDKSTGQRSAEVAGSSRITNKVSF